MNPQFFGVWVYEAQNRSVLDIHEDSSIEATNKFAEEIELRRKSSIFFFSLPSPSRNNTALFKLAHFYECDPRKNICDPSNYS
ncbi:MAG: hypothetical protein LBS83_02650 [Holosporales bacterium]|nr:hypothetical protein [Holosporales bacterium]